MKASYTKLKSGDWGIRIEKPAGPDALRAGTTVTVMKRDGSSKTETVGCVLWADNDVAICAISKVATPRTTTTARKGNYGCRECRGPIRDARHHRAMGGLCGDCAFDEYDC